VAKIIRSGIFIGEQSFPQRPPPGLREVCSRCVAVIETEGNEEEEVTIFADPRSGHKLPVWLIKCPECKKQVKFFPTNVPTDVYRKLNGGMV
jgi:phage FluMu protein Com